MVILEDLFPFSPELGYLSIIIVSFVGSLVVFIPIPYFPLLLTASLSGRLDPHLIAVASALGSVAAKTIIFFASYYGRNVLSENTKKRMLPLQRLVGRYGWPGAFAAAATPIPDDIIYIPLGIAKYSPWKFALATFAGKVVMNEAIVWSTVFFGRPIVEDVLSRPLDNITLVTIAAASVAVMGAFVYYTLRIDWAKLLGRWFPWALEDKD